MKVLALLILMLTSSPALAATQLLNTPISCFAVSGDDELPSAELADPTQDNLVATLPDGRTIRAGIVQREHIDGPIELLAIWVSQPNGGSTIVSYGSRDAHSVEIFQQYTLDDTIREGDLAYMCARKISDIDLAVDSLIDVPIADEE